MTVHRTHYRLTLRSDSPHRTNAETVRKLRALLKIALRVFGFRCVEVSETTPEQVEVST